MIEFLLLLFSFNCPLTTGSLSLSVATPNSLLFPRLSLTCGPSQKHPDVSGANFSSYDPTLLTLQVLSKCFLFQDIPAINFCSPSPAFKYVFPWRPLLAERGTHYSHCLLGCLSSLCGFNLFAGRTMPALLTVNSQCLTLGRGAQHCCWVNDGVTVWRHELRLGIAEGF